MRFARTALPTMLAGAVTILAAMLGGCGSSAPAGTSASPATVTPATAPLYIDAVVTPTGSLETDATSVASTITRRPKPFASLLTLLQGPTGKTPAYEKEVKPWLGPHAGIFLGSIDASGSQGLIHEVLTKALSEGLTGAEAALLGSGGLPALADLASASARRSVGSSAVQGALVLDTTNVTTARSFLEAQAHSVGAHAASYRGVAYQVAPDGIAEGIVHRFAVIGSEAGIRSVIDTASGDPSLAQAPDYAKLASTAEAGALANAYLSLEALTHSVKAAGGGGESALSLLRGLLGDPGQAYLSLIPSPNTVTLDVDTLSSEAESQPSSTSTGGGTGTTGAQVLRGLPGSAWLAVGIGDLGRTVGGNAQGLQALASLASGVNIGTISLKAVFAPLSSPSLNVQSDLLSWMGATGAYVSGSSILSLQAAILITSKDPARSRAAVGKLARAYREAGGQTSSTSVPGTETAVTVKLPNFPLALTMAAGQGKFVIGLGAASVREALNPQTTLAGTPAYDAATSALGQGIQPSALIEFHTLSGLIESLGLSQAPGFSGIASAVAPLGATAVGGGESLSGGVKRARVVVGLQPAG